MIGAHILVRRLQEYKVDVIFSLPGDTCIPLCFPVVLHFLS
jgi:thiamine pyrophosphate-dependent acetolactate synthase large subunit-like protein